MFRFDQTASVVTAVSTASLLSSVIFNIGYFSFFGFEYIHFLSISDHVIAAIIWVPLVLFSGIGIYLSGFGEQIGAKMVFVVFGDDVRRYQRWVTSIFRKAPIFFGVVSLTLATSISTSAYGHQDLNVALVLAVVMIFALFVGWVVRKLELGIKLPLLPIALASVVTMGVILFALGHYWAEKDFERVQERRSSFVMQDGSLRQLGVLRSVSGGLIVYDSGEHSVQLISSNSVSSISRRSESIQMLLQPERESAVDVNWKNFIRWLRGES